MEVKIVFVNSVDGQLKAAKDPVAVKADERMVLEFLDAAGCYQVDWRMMPADTQEVLTQSMKNADAEIAMFVLNGRLVTESFAKGTALVPHVETMYSNVQVKWQETPAARPLCGSDYPKIRDKAREGYEFFLAGVGMPCYGGYIRPGTGLLVNIA